MDSLNLLVCGLDFRIQFLALLAQCGQTLLFRCRQFALGFQLINIGLNQIPVEFPVINPVSQYVNLASALDVLRPAFHPGNDALVDGLEVLVNLRQLVTITLQRVGHAVFGPQFVEFPRFLLGLGKPIGQRDYLRVEPLTGFRAGINAVD